MHVDIGADEYYIPGDANGDGIVSFEDFSALQNHYGQSGRTWAEGDFNGDGMVTFEDFPSCRIIMVKVAEPPIRCHLQSPSAVAVP